MMQVKELKKEGLSHEMEITLTAKDIDQRVETKLKEVGKTIKMPGFRPGKVPLAILKQKYGKAIMGEVLESAVNESSQKALEEKKLRPAVQPKIEVKSFDEGKDLTYTMAVEVLPGFKVADFKGAKLEKLVAKADEKAIQDAVDKIAANNQGTQVVESTRAAKDGDTVVINFKGRTAHDNKEHDGMAMDGHHLKLGSGMFIPGFEDQLIGSKKGQSVEVKVKFPEQYGAKELAGKDAIFDVEVTELREPAEAKVDDEFAKSLGLDSLDALKKAIEEQLEQEYSRHSRMTLKKSLMDYLDETHDFDIPQGMVDMEYDNIVHQIEMDRKRHQHDDCDTGCDHDHGSMISDEEKAELKDIAVRRVRLGLVLSEVGNTNNIKVSDPEIQKAVVNEARRYPGQERQVFDFYSKNQNALESLRAPLFEEKVVDYILELANVTEKTVTAEELLRALEDEEPAGEGKKSEKAESKKSTAKKKKA